MVLGASYAGQKSMTATSGPGISLMTEMLGLASMAEIPAVVVDCQRAGPSTGMPTRHEQGDLNLAVLRRARRGAAHRAGADQRRWTASGRRSTPSTWPRSSSCRSIVAAGHGPGGAHREHPDARPVAASRSSIARRSRIAKRATATSRLRRVARVPSATCAIRSRRTASRRWRSPGRRAAPYVATGLEHTQAANTTLGCAQPLGDDRKALPQARRRPSRRRPPAHEYGDPSAEIGFLTWGSTLGAVVEAIDRLAAATGIKAHALAPRHGLAAADASDRSVPEEQAQVSRARGQLHRPVRPAAEDALPERRVHAHSTCTAASRSAWPASSRP